MLRGFKSHTWHFKTFNSKEGNAPIAQLVRASVLWAESRGFEPRWEHPSSYPSLVKGERLKIVCNMLRGFKSHTWHSKRPSIVKKAYQSVFPSLVKGERLKIACYMLRGFKSHSWHSRLSSKVASGRQTTTFLVVGRGRTPAFLAGDGGSNPLGDACPLSSVGRAPDF